MRLGGFGLRSQADLSPAAFVGAVEQTLPSFIGEKGVCTQLVEVIGDMNESEQRWQPLLDTGCRTGTKLSRAWQYL